MSKSDSSSRGGISFNNMSNTKVGSELDDLPDRIAAHLREMSEHAMQAGLGRSSSLIEVAALMIELEGAADIQLDPET